jgi:hypothetical protein
MKLIQLNKNMDTPKLYLILTRRWFDRHLKDKSEEYRLVTPYWCAKFLTVNGNRMPRAWWRQQNIDSGEALEKLIDEGQYSIETVPYQSIVFSNGMRPVNILPRFEKRFFGLRIGIGKQEWGAPKHPVFVLKCGKPQNLINYKAKTKENGLKEAT